MVVRLARACMTGTITRNRRINLQPFFSIATQSQHEPPSADSPFAKEVRSLAEAGRGLCYPNRRMGPLLSEGPRNAKKPTSLNPTREYSGWKGWDCLAAQGERPGCL